MIIFFIMFINPSSNPSVPALCASGANNCMMVGAVLGQVSNSPSVVVSVTTKGSCFSVVKDNSAVRRMSSLARPTMTSYTPLGANQSCRRSS